mmetsp:Transcript_42072/g.94179  ORF Transcript_42072/g.94179 Transcript_42072/m.94179 type:complete len:95 (+) Transcript_42072:3-287(+)
MRHVLIPNVSVGAAASRGTDTDGDSATRVVEVAGNPDLENESGAAVWDSALCLGEMLVKRQIVVGPRVVELGSGTGYVGLLAAALGHRATLTAT